MIRIHKVLDVKGRIFEQPNWNINNNGMEIKFRLVPDKKSELPYFNLCYDLVLTHVMVFKRNIYHEDLDKWVKGTYLSETGFLCDMESEINGKDGTIKFVLIL